MTFNYFFTVQLIIIFLYIIFRCRSTNIILLSFRHLDFIWIFWIWVALHLTQPKIKHEYLVPIKYKIRKLFFMHTENVCLTTNQLFNSFHKVRIILGTVYRWCHAWKERGGDKGVGKVNMFAAAYVKMW